MIEFRRARPTDVPLAMQLAERVFIQYEVPDYAPGALAHFQADCTRNTGHLNRFSSGEGVLYVAADGEQIVGVIGERNHSHIMLLFVEGAYHRQGIATALMNLMVMTLKPQGVQVITVNASPYSLPFYRRFGFAGTEPEQHRDGFIFTPMAYTGDGYKKCQQRQNGEETE